MESANIPHHHHHHHHHHQQQQHHTLQDQLIVGSSTTTLDLSGYAAASAPGWTPNTFLNNGGFNSAANVAILSSRNPRLQHDLLVSSLHGSVTQDFSFDWANNTTGNNFINQFSHDYSLQLARIKRELSDSYTNFSEMISSPSSSIEDVQVQMQPTSYRKNQQRDMNDPNIKLLLKKLSSGSQNNGLQYCPEEFYCSTSSTSTPAATPRRGTFSQIYPTINVSSNFSQASLANPSSFDMNLQALDLLNSARFSGSFRQSMQDQLGLPKNGFSYGYDCTKQSIQLPIEPNDVTPFSNGVAEAERSNINLDPKAPKRARLESRASCPPFKVRKEKLGDRIAALQQLVAPFGKTDTASVLMEAIGYIKFLQSQVETLSVPYIKSSRNKANRAAHGITVENGSEEKRRDLRSRGMCLVPISCLSYMTDSAGSVWPPPSFGGGT